MKPTTPNNSCITIHSSASCNSQKKAGGAVAFMRLVEDGKVIKSRKIEYIETTDATAHRLILVVICTALESLNKYKDKLIKIRVLPS